MNAAPLPVGWRGLPAARKREALLSWLRTQIPVIAPSMLKCDFGNLQREFEQLERAQTRLYHLDVMDGHFVPNLSYGPMVIERMRAFSEIPFDAHLMISDPERYLDEYLRAGCDLITVHIEAVPNPRNLLERIRQGGAASGLAINPDTPVSAVKACLDACDLVLVMSVHPGFGGQTFISDVVPKIADLRAMCSKETLISVDGGIGISTISQTAAAGASVFVAGSSIFDQSDYTLAMQSLEAEAEAGRAL